MSTVTTLGVTGMTCANCVAHVTADLSAVAGVDDVSVALHAGGVSEVSVFSTAPLDEATLRTAVDDAGYDVASLAVETDALAAQQAAQAPARQSAHDGACGCGHEHAAREHKTFDLHVPPHR